MLADKISQRKSTVGEKKQSKDIVIRKENWIGYEEDPSKDTLEGIIRKVGGEPEKMEAKKPGKN